MSKRRNIKFNSGADTTVTIDSDQTSDAIPAHFEAHTGIQANTTGATVEGTLDIEYSIDGENWTPSDMTTALIRGADTVIWDLPPSGVSFYRVRYRFQAGTGTLQLWANSKRS